MFRPSSHHRRARRQARRRGRHALYASCLVALAAGGAAAEPTSGIDAALFRSSYDAGGIFSLEGARLAPKGDLSFKLLGSFERTPLEVAVPGIGLAAGDTEADRVLDFVAVLDMAFGLSLTDRIGFGLDVAAFRTSFGRGYGKRGRYAAGGAVTRRSTGVVALRPLTNIDQSASRDDASAYLGDGEAGPLDARFGIKLGVFAGQRIALTAVGTVVLPFGDDEMLLGDRDLSFEPRLAADWRPDQITGTRVVANLGARIRRRTVLQSYDVQDAMATQADAQAYLDIASEALVGLGAIYQISPRLTAGAEAQMFIPLPGSLAWGDCKLFSGARCDTLTGMDYFAGAEQGDFTTQATAGITLQVTRDVAAALLAGTSFGGARGDELRLSAGVVWAPQVSGSGSVEAGRNDKDRDGVADSLDACAGEAEDKDGFQDEDGCPDSDNDGDGVSDSEDACASEPEDKDGFQDSDGCPEGDNDGDGVPDAADRCPAEAEDKDGFEDEDGCPDDDNDGDGFADKVDRCPNDAETGNGFEDDDGCPDVRGTGGPEERADRIDLKGQTIAFARATLTAPSRQLLAQVAALIKARRLQVRVEVHVPLGTRSANPAQIAAQKRRDKLLAQQRARLIADYMASQGVTAQQLQAVGIGSDRPLGTAPATDPVNERVDFIKAQQGGVP